MRRLLPLLVCTPCVLLAVACTNRERPVADLVYTGWVSGELKRELDVSLGRIANEAGVRLRVREPRGPAPDAEGTAAIVVRASDMASPLHIGAPELGALNALEPNVARGGSLCLLLVDAPEIKVTNDARWRRQEAEQRVRIPQALAQTYPFTYVAPSYAAWRGVRVEIIRSRLQATAPALLAVLARECNAALARRIVDDSGIASIPSHLRIDRPRTTGTADQRS